MAKKMRRFNGEEGSEIEFESKTGRNENISDDTRARARKFVEDKEETKVAPKAAKSSTPTPKASTPAPAPKAEAKPKPETKEEYTGRMEDLTKKQALEKVEPENYVPGAGMLKGVLKNIASRGAKSAAKSSAPALEAPIPRLSGPTSKAEIPRLPAPKAESLTTAEKKELTGLRSRIRKNDDKEISVRARALKEIGKENDTASKNVRARADKALEGMKFGGSVKSASSRADGCAIRGKTRA